MKITLVVALIFASSLSLARYNPFEGVDSELCPDMKVTGRDSFAICQAENKNVVLSAKTGANLTASESRVLKFNTYGAVDLGLVPDDSSDTAYFYSRWLVTPMGQKVGVMTIEGWTNSEMESSAKFTVRYNLKGQIVSIAIGQMN